MFLLTGANVSFHEHSWSVSSFLIWSWLSLVSSDLTCTWGPIGLDWFESWREELERSFMQRVLVRLLWFFMDFYPHLCWWPPRGKQPLQTYLIWGESSTRHNITTFLHWTNMNSHGIILFVFSLYKIYKSSNSCFPCWSAELLYGWFRTTLFFLGPTMHAVDIAPLHS